MTAAASSSARGAVLSSLACSIITKRGARSPGRRGRRRAHAHVGEGRLITAMREWLRGPAHVEVLLWKLGRELETGLGRYVCHVLLEWVESAGHGLIRGHHAHVEVLLLSGLDLLLLLLQQFDLLLDRELFHCTKEEIRVSMPKVKPWWHLF